MRVRNVSAVLVAGGGVTGGATTMARARRVRFVLVGSAPTLRARGGRSR
jgi:hypothetical protein